MKNRKNLWWYLGLIVVLLLGFLVTSCHSDPPDVAGGEDDLPLVENAETDSSPRPSSSPKASNAADPRPDSSRTDGASPTRTPEIETYSREWFETYAPSALLSEEEQVKDLTGSEEKNDDPERYRLFVDVSNQLVFAYEKGEDGEYSVCRIMPCTTGRDGSETTGGTFEMGGDKRRFGYFESFECYAQYWSQIQGEIYFHSVLYSKEDEDTLIQDSYDHIGEAVSHGCVRLYVPDAKWIYYNCPEGTKVEVDIAEVDEELKQAILTGEKP